MMTFHIKKKVHEQKIFVSGLDTKLDSTRFLSAAQLEHNNVDRTKCTPKLAMNQVVAMVTVIVMDFELLLETP